MFSLFECFSHARDESVLQNFEWLFCCAERFPAQFDIPSDDDGRQQQLCDEVREILLIVTRICPDYKVFERVRWILKKLPKPRVSRSKISNPIGSNKLAQNDEIRALQSRAGKMWNDSYFLQPSKFQNEYKDVQLIAEGGFGFVCKVRKVADGQDYALKVIPFRYKSPEATKQILREVALFRSLPSHPHVVGYKCSFPEFCIMTTRKDCPIENKPFDRQFSTCSTTSTGSDLMSTGSDGMSSPSSFSSGSLSDWITFQGSSQMTQSTPSSFSSDESFTWSNVGEKRPLGETSEFYEYELDIGAAVYIQMELCGENLEKWIRNRNDRIFEQASEENMRRPFNFRKPIVEYVNMRECSIVFAQILKGIHVVHENNLIHRDLKPHNILFGLDGNVKIGDFGLATIDQCEEQNFRKFSQTKSTDSENYTCHTLDIGTLGYAAPEQRTSTSYDRKVDIYSLGIILLELFYPFATEAEKWRCFDHIRKTWCVPKDMRQKCPHLADIILKMTSSNPATRPDAAELLKMEFFNDLDPISRLVSKVQLM